MEIRSFKKKKNNKYEIIFKDNSSIELYDNVIIEYNLLIDKKIKDEKLEEIMKYNASLDAYFLTLKYLNSKMRTKLEIRKYLEKKEFDSKTINDTINKLEKNKVIDEEFYLKAFVNDQIKFNNYGPNKIANKLLSLGISKDKSYEYLNTFEENTWKEKITKIVNKKIKSNKNYSNVMLKSKIIAALSNEGYDKDMINAVLDKSNFKTNPDVILKEYNKQKKKLEKKFDGDALKFQIKIKLKTKGFTNDEIEKLLNF